MNVPAESGDAFQEAALGHVDGALAELNESDRVAQSYCCNLRRTFPLAGPSRRRFAKLAFRSRNSRSGVPMMLTNA